MDTATRAPPASADRVESRHIRADRGFWSFFEKIAAFSIPRSVPIRHIFMMPRFIAAEHLCRDFYKATAPRKAQELGR
jgi:hypothetical protein